MEQTLGKRIMQYRKQLGLTQDALAEQLGVTAQAVSKWENDQSCPDIFILPKLSEIFGVTTDTLLGVETPVHTAEVVTEEDTDSSQQEGIHSSKGGWEFQWDSGWKEGISFALFVLLTGALTLICRIWNLNTSFWDILWPCALLCIGIRRLFSKFSFFGIGCTLFGSYFLVENLEIWKLDMGGELVFPVIVILFGLSLLVDTLRKPRKPKFQIRRKGSNSQDGSEKTKSTFVQSEDTFDCSLSFGGTTRTISLPKLRSGNANCAFGELVVNLQECEEISEDCTIYANCSFGELVLEVPQKYRVNPITNTTFANLDISGTPDPNPVGIITLDGSVSFGEIQIRYI